MTDDTDLLAAVLADRADDHLRLVYADWLDEAGEPNRAEFIRIQIDIARKSNGPNPSCPHCGGRFELATSHLHLCYGC